MCAHLFTSTKVSINANDRDPDAERMHHFFLNFLSVSVSATRGSIRRGAPDRLQAVQDVERPGFRVYGGVDRC
jgi:hypothetical protein